MLSTAIPAEKLHSDGEASEKLQVVLSSYLFYEFTQVGRSYLIKMQRSAAMMVLHQNQM